MRPRLTVLAFCAALAAGCSNAPPSAPADGAAAKPSVSTAPTPTKDASPMTDAAKANIPADAPPSAASAMYVIYNVDGDGATSYEIENGSVATFWYAHDFALGGKRYHTAFAYDTPEKYSAQEKAAAADALTKVTLTQATFELTAPGTAKAWSFLGAERSIGEFGASEKGNALDASRKPVDATTRDGRYLLAVPGIASMPAAGTRVFSVFVFNPEKSSDVNKTRWVYLGDVLSGRSGGTFVTREGEALPAFETGGGEITTPSGPQRIPDTYVFDDANNAYLEVQ